MRLHSPVAIGDWHLRNRIIMAPMTRSRAGIGKVPSALAETYYLQRATAGLIISEALHVSEDAIGYPDTPGMQTQLQVEGWRRITDAVHGAGGLIVAQLWHVGRLSIPAFQPSGGVPIAPSAVAPPGAVYTADGPVAYGLPRAADAADIVRIVGDFGAAAARARKAGFDGVELHGANGYLIDQFLRDASNQRTDRYGGSIENRARFLVEVLGAVTDVWGPRRVGVHLSLTNRSGGMSDADPVALAGYIAAQVNRFEPAYMLLVEPVAGRRYDPAAPRVAPTVRAQFTGALILNGGYTVESAESAIGDGLADAIAFGIPFLANPDLPERLRRRAPLNAPDRATFYGGGEKGYTDYPVLDSVD